MEKKKLFLLMGALVVAIGTALAARSLLSAPAPQAEAVVAPAPAAPSGTRVLVAQRALPVGTIITADAMQFQAWPKDMVRDAYFLDGQADMAKLLGTVVRFPITAGEPVTQGSLVAPGDRGFLAAALGPGMRAITVPVSDNTGVGGFIFPGDRVDLMVTQEVTGEGGPALKTAETVLRNLRVLATDKSTETTTENGKTIVRSSSNVTFEVTPRIAEKITVAQQVGTISLVLRSIADNQSELERAVASGAVKIPEGASKAEEEKILGQVASRPVEGSTSFVTGGDVSRFQRRTVPAKPMTAPVAGAPAGVVSGPVGPVVRVTRGKETTAVPVGK